MLWYREEDLVALSQKKDFRLLKTAYHSERNHTIRKLRRERNGFYKVSGEVKKKLRPPTGQPERPRYSFRTWQMS